MGSIKTAYQATSNSTVAHASSMQKRRMILSPRSVQARPLSVECQWIADELYQHRYQLYKSVFTRPLNLIERCYDKELHVILQRMCNRLTNLSLTLTWIGLAFQLAGPIGVYPWFIWHDRKYAKKQNKKENFHKLRLLYYFGSLQSWANVCQQLHWHFIC